MKHLGKLFKAGKGIKDGYYYFAEYADDSMAMALIAGDFTMIDGHDILMIRGTENTKPQSKITSSQFSNHEYEGDIIGSGSIDEVEDGIKNGLVVEA